MIFSFLLDPMLDFFQKITYFKISARFAEEEKILTEKWELSKLSDSKNFKISYKGEDVTNNPLEQFELTTANNFEIISSAFFTWFTRVQSILFFSFNISINITEIVFSMFLFIFFLIFSFFLNNKLLEKRYTNSAKEIFWNNIQFFIIENAALSQQVYTPLFGTFIFILTFYNLYGLSPFSFTFTAHIICTFFFSFIIFFGLNFIAIKKHQKKYFNIFIPQGVPFNLLFIMILLEIISYVSRPFSLSIRLFANMMAGHALLKILTSFVFENFKSISGFSILISFFSLGILFIILSMEFVITFLQVFVFVTLFALYLKDVQHTSHLKMLKIKNFFYTLLSYIFVHINCKNRIRFSKLIQMQIVIDKQKIIFEPFSFTNMSISLIIFFIICIIFFIGILVFTAAFTLVERKLMGLYQRREGPDKVGFEGIGQPFADGLKVIKKEIVIPKDTAESRLFFIAPLISLWVSLTLWSLIPFTSIGSFCNSEVSLLIVLGLSSISSYGVIFAGWASNNKYAFMGALRAVSQFISYEIIFSILLLPVITVVGSTNLLTINFFQENAGWFVYLTPFWGLTFVVLLAETNRTPFDLPEAEAELVSGFNVEYSSLLFAFFFLAEYAGMGFLGALLTLFFFGGWDVYNPFETKTKQFIAEKERSLYMSKFDYKPFGKWKTSYQNEKKYKYSNFELDVLTSANSTSNSKNSNFFNNKFSFNNFYKKCEEFENIFYNKDVTNYDFSQFYWNIPSNPTMSTFDHWTFNTQDIFKSDYGVVWSIIFDDNQQNFSFFDFISICNMYSYIIPVIFVSLKIEIICIFFIFMRASLPRKRFDQLIILCWKYFFPFSFALSMFFISIIYSSTYINLFFYNLLCHN